MTYPLILRTSRSCAFSNVHRIATGDLLIAGSLVCRNIRSWGVGGEAVGCSGCMI